MATYRFRVTFEDYDDVTRDIEIRSTQTFEEFHHAIQNAIGFDASKQYNVSNVAAIPVPEDFDIAIDDEIDEEEESEELLVEENELPIGEEKEEFVKADESTDDDFVSADEDAIDDEGTKEGDEF